MKKVVIAILAALISAAAGAGNTGTAQLSWTAPTTDVDGVTLAPGSVKYNVYEGLSTTSMVKALTGLTTLAASRTGLQDGAVYYYYVTAVNTAGESVKSGTVSKTMPAALPSKPNAPTNVSAQ